MVTTGLYMVNQNRVVSGFPLCPYEQLMIMMMMMTLIIIISER
jgi:hypothetical protein